MPKMRPLPPIERLNELLAYDATTGDLTWKVNRGKVKAGDIAGSINPAGYRVVSVRQDGKVYNCFAHRLAWALHYGEDPYPYEVDHKHHNRDDNRISELRLATHSQNQANRATHPQRPIRVTYPDGRGSTVVDSQQAANRLLGRDVWKALRRPDGMTYQPGPEPGSWVPSGITVCYEM